MDGVCDACRGSGRTIQQAFHAACKRKNESCALRLIEAGADVNAFASEDQNPLCMAVRGGMYRLTKILINAGADVNASTWLHPPVLLAATNNPPNDAEKFIRLLINSGANVNMTSIDGSTALMIAAYGGTSPAVITALIDAGADVNMRNSHDKSAFTAAALRNFYDGLELLIEAADKMGPTRIYLPPLSSVEFNSQTLKLSTIKLLLRTGIKINVIHQYYNNTLTHYIVDCKRFYNRLNKDICMLLFAAGERVTGPVVEGRRTYNHDIVEAQVPDYLLHKDLQMCLKHLCREAIKKHLLELDPHTHLFGRVPRLGLPKSLTEYLLYNQTLDDDQDDDDQRTSAAAGSTHTSVQ